MTTAPDFDFGFGRNRHLRGRGWRGVLALATLLTALILALWIGSPVAGNTFRLIVAAFR